jgi:hypothetical protein
MAAVAMLLGAVVQPAGAEQVDYTKFDHMTTGFPLDGQHLNLRCEQCHLNGIFEGTPRQCSQCHVQGNSRSAVFMPVNHIPTPLPCDSCHTTNTFQGTHFAHSNVMPGTCAQCHNNINAVGKGPNHVVTSAPCDQCHTTISFAGSFAAFPPGHIPTTQPCRVCHSAGYSMTLTQMLHTGISGGCTTCHAADALATAPVTFTMQAVQTWPAPALTVQLTPTSQNYHLPTPSSPSHFPIKESCDVCHTTPAAPMAVTAAAAGFAGGKMSHAGITSGCASCHYSAGTPGDVQWIGMAAKGPPGTVGTPGAGNHIPMAGAPCESCHDPASTNTGGFKITTMPQLSATGHAAVSSLSCATCHATGLAWQGVPSLMTQLSNHIPIAGADCKACHGSNFASGGFKITSSPTLSTANHTLVSSLTCASCHENNPTDLGFQGVLTQIYLRPAAAAMAGLSKADPAHASGLLATQDCAQCHNTTPPFAGGTLPTAHIPLPSAAACATCHAAGYGPGLSKMVHSVVTSESCATCHGPGKGPFSGASPGTGGQPIAPPGTLGSPGSGNHIPIGGADCAGCHTSADAMTGTGFMLTGAPVLSAAGHAAVNALACQACHTQGMAWKGVTTLVTPPGAVGTPGATNHIALGTGDCKTCHASNFTTGGFKIATAPSLSAAGHAAVSGQSCDSCHAVGNTSWATNVTTVAPGPMHIAFIAGSVCSNCHASNFVTGGFAITTKPVLTAAGHAYVSTTCNTCHENLPANLTFQGVGNSIYLRPGTAVHGLSPIDNAHATGNLATQDCTNCHNTTPPFNGNNLPNNHIPLPSTATPACAVCHGAGYAVGKSIMVHSAVASETCSTCHGKGKSFAGTSQGAGGQPLQQPGTVGTPGTGNHIPIASAECNVCHTASDAMTGTGFHISTTPQLSAAGHAAVASLSCNTCHATGNAMWANNVTAMTPGATHIPMATAACSACHASNGFIAGGFKISTSPVMSVASHTSVSSMTCMSCHENNGTDLAFQGVGTTIYVRPLAAAAGLSPADANHATGALGVPNDCKNCHTTTPPFAGSASGSKPTGHIASSAVCTNCHTGYTAATTGMNHADSGVGTAGSPVACATCHGAGAGPFFGTAQGGCTATSCTGGQPLQPPAPVGQTGGHVPFNNVACNICHTSTTVPGGFKGTVVPHTNGPFMTYTRGKGTPNSGTSSPYKCNVCHAPAGQKWFGTSQGTKTEGAHENSTPSSDCIDCHSPTGGFAAAAAAAAKAKPRPTTGLTKRPAGSPAAPTTGPAPRSTPPGATPRPVAGSASVTASGPFSHSGVAPGSCATCHRAAGSATAMPGGHLPTALSCDACHRTTAWKPATYAHAGVGPGHCASCHAAAGKWATPKPAGHFLTSRSCDVCHHSTNTWLPVMYDHLSPRYRPQTGIVRCIDCHTTNTEMVVPGPSTPAGRKALPGGPIRNR